MLKITLIIFILVSISGLFFYNNADITEQLEFDEENIERDPYINPEIKAVAENCVQSAMPGSVKNENISNFGYRDCRKLTRIQKPLEEKCTNGDKSACKQLKEVSKAEGFAVYEYLSKYVGPDSINSNSLSKELKNDIKRCGEIFLNPKFEQDTDIETKRSCEKMKEINTKCSGGNKKACSLMSQIMMDQAFASINKRR